jgi:purine-binding chemotaxis protein CheW
MENQGGKYVTFLLDKENYGIPIKKVREIIGMMEIIHIPKTQSYIKGIINLRGKIIPLMDLRLKFGMNEKAYNERTCIIVIEINLLETQRLVGIVVDTVSEVVKIQKGDIDPSPDYNVEGDGDVLTGIGKLKDKVIMILDIEKILNHDEITMLERGNVFQETERK